MGAGAGGILLLQVFKVANFKHTLFTSSRKWLHQPPLEQLLHSAFRKLKDTRIASIQKGTLINAFNQYILNLLRSVNVACLKREPVDTHVRACEVHQANTSDTPSSVPAHCPVCCSLMHSEALHSACLLSVGVRRPPLHPPPTSLPPSFS